LQTIMTLVKKILSVFNIISNCNFMKSTLELSENEESMMIAESHPWFMDLAAWVLPLLTAVSFREAIKTHACHYRGDTIAKMVGLGSFSLTKNLDPFGSALGPLVLIIRQKGLVYGWAKGTEIRPDFLNKGRWDAAFIILIALLSNYIMAAGWACFGKLGLLFNDTFPRISEFMLLMGKNGVEINLLLMIVHLIPVPPMDISYLVRSYLPQVIRMAYTPFDYVGQYLIYVVIFLKAAQPQLGIIMGHLQTHLFDTLGFSL